MNHINNGHGFKKMQISKPKPQPPILTIVSTAGVGKSTLGALFPSPIFIQAEESGAAFEKWSEDAQPDLAPRLPRARRKDKNAQCYGNQTVEMSISTKNGLLDQLRWLASEKHQYKTVVVDTVTTLNKLFEHEITESYCVDNVAEAAGGFHKGFIVAQEMHSEIVNACEALRKKGLAIVFLAHTGLQRIKNRPDVDEYVVYSLDMHEKSVSVYANLSDAVIYIKKEEFVQGTKQDKKGNTTKYGKMVATGERVLVTSGDGLVGFVNAKNRYKMPVEIPLKEGENPLLEYIPFFDIKEKEDETLRD